jgi:hypothetical protein
MEAEAVSETSGSNSILTRRECIISYIDKEVIYVAVVTEKEGNEIKVLRG